MKNPKSNSRAARKLARKNKLQMGETPAFRKLKKMLRQRYLDGMASLETVARRWDDAIKAPWMKPDYIKKIREELKVSREELQGLSGVSKESIANYESGVSPITLEHAHDIFVALEARGSNEAGEAVVDVIYGLLLSMREADAMLKGEAQMIEEQRKFIADRSKEFQEAIGAYNKRQLQRSIVRTRKVVVDEAIKVFLAEHPDYEDAGEAGKQNGVKMKAKLDELGLKEMTVENFSKVYLLLKNEGLLALKTVNES